MRIGIIGTGFVSEWFIDACRAVPGADPVAIFSRNPGRGQRFAARWGLMQSFSDVDALLGSDIDAVYVASPMAVHAGQTIAALNAGKHVLCEKTLGITLDETHAMQTAADKAGRVLLEAVRPLHDPAWQTIMDALPMLGRVWQAGFHKCQYSSRYDAFRGGEILNAFNPYLGNSALFDIGVYCVQPAVFAFGTPASVHAESRFLPNGFEASGTIVLGYADTTLTCSYSKVTEGTTPSWIEGEDATMTIDSIAEPSRVVIHSRKGSQRTLRTLVDAPSRPANDNMRHEIARFVQLCADGQVRHPWVAISEESMRIMTMALGAAH